MTRSHEFETHATKYTLLSNTHIISDKMKIRKKSEQKPSGG